MASSRNDDVAVSSTRAGATSDRPESPTPVCTICYMKCEEKSYCDPCLHAFCFKCIQKWAEVKTICPLCRGHIDFIIHNVRSVEDYDLYKVHDPQMISNRRAIYAGNMYSQPIIGALNRECSAQFYRDHPSEIERLKPWIEREIAALMTGPTFSPCGLIIDILTVHDIWKPGFRRVLCPIFGHRTHQFIHELTNFARSPYDMQSYDTMVHYVPNNTEVIDLTSLPDDD